MALNDALGNLIDFRPLPGQAHDLRGTAALIEGSSCGKPLADRAFDANWLREALADARIEAVIPPKSNRRFPAEFDRDTYLAPPHRELLREAEGIQGYRYTLLQDRHQFQRIHCPRINRHPASVNVNRP